MFCPDGFGPFPDNKARLAEHPTSVASLLSPVPARSPVLLHIIETIEPKRFGMARHDLQNSYMFFLCSHNIGNFNELLRPLNTAQNRENTRVSR